MFYTETVTGSAVDMVIRKWFLSILKMMELLKPELSMRKKWLVVSLRPIQYLEEILS